MEALGTCIAVIIVFTVGYFLLNSWDKNERYHKMEAMKYDAEFKRRMHLREYDYKRWLELTIEEGACSDECLLLFKEDLRMLKDIHMPLSEEDAMDIFRGKSSREEFESGIKFQGVKKRIESIEERLKEAESVGFVSFKGATLHNCHLRDHYNGIYDFFKTTNLFKNDYIPITKSQAIKLLEFDNNEIDKLYNHYSFCGPSFEFDKIVYEFENWTAKETLYLLEDDEPLNINE
jgi:hypothetical protein